jgi:hypothetical protein
MPTSKVATERTNNTETEGGLSGKSSLANTKWRLSTSSSIGISMMVGMAIALLSS